MKLDDVRCLQCSLMYHFGDDGYICIANAVKRSSSPTVNF